MPIDQLATLLGASPGVAALVLIVVVVSGLGWAAMWAEHRLGLDSEADAAG